MKIEQSTNRDNTVKLEPETFLDAYQLGKLVALLPYCGYRQIGDEVSYVEFSINNLIKFLEKGSE